MKVLLLNLPRYRDKLPVVREECCYGATHAVPFPNTLLHVGTVITSLHNNFKVYLYDSVLLNVDFHNLRSYLIIEKPDLIITTLLFYTFSYESEIDKICDELNIKYIPIPSPFGYANSFIKKINPLFIIYDEPEKTIIDYLTGTSINLLKGIIYKQNNNILKNQIQNPYFDKLPPTNWSLLGNYGSKYGWKLYQISRNCPFNCNFCVWGGKKFRIKPVEVVIRDINRIKEISGDNKISLLTSSISADKNWFYEFIWKVKKLNVKFYTDISVNDANKEILYLLKKAGCIGILIGIESFNEEILKSLNKKIDLNKTEELIKYSRRIGLPVTITLMFNLGEKEETLNDYITKTKILAPTNISCVIYKALEGTKAFNNSLPYIYFKFWGSDAVATNNYLKEALEYIKKFNNEIKILKLKNLFLSLKNFYLLKTNLAKLVLKILNLNAAKKIKHYLSFYR